MLDFESVGPGFESHSEHFLNLFHGSPELLNRSATLVNSQLFCLPPVKIFNHVMFHLQYLFQLFEWHACKLAGLSKDMRYRGKLNAPTTIIINLFFVYYLTSSPFPLTTDEKSTLSMTIHSSYSLRATNFRGVDYYSGSDRTNVCWVKEGCSSLKPAACSSLPLEVVDHVNEFDANKLNLYLNTGCYSGNTLQNQLNNAPASCNPPCFRITKPGEYCYMSTRNNNFSNRRHIGQITVV